MKNERFVYKFTLRSGQRAYYNPTTKEWGKEPRWPWPKVECDWSQLTTPTVQERTEIQEWEEFIRARKERGL